MQERLIRIGTRGSALALAQAHEVKGRLMAAHGLPETAFEIVIIKTTGDMILDRPLSEVGGKGLFTKEIEEALFEKRIDLAVHSMKDMQTALPDGLVIGATLPREDVRDAFISLKHKSFDSLPQGAVVGTSSLRRQAQIKRIRPDLQIVGFRGNVQTRLTKLRDEVAEATFLACAGLRRLGLADHITDAVPVERMLPAVAQGAIGIEIRVDDEDTAKIIAPLDDQATSLCVTAERAFLGTLEGSCRTPIAGLARLEGGTLTFKGETLSPDGRRHVVSSKTGPASSAADLGVTVADDILSRGGREVLQS
ncbi:MAG: hydroxymethylbilane synthase [Hyphomicrobium sp. 32-62-53]|nr:MAG: hydroxymethylbilane synthase [Hyphomicrobium sp. 12-62-95]OYY01880.1 MAG: hydroxymethylbilane synthase [Hyphomicrobium sp. 32-62-53]